MTKSRYAVLFLAFLISVFLFVGTASAQSVYYPSHGNGNGTFTVYTNPVICEGAGGTTPCAQYNEVDLRVDMDRYSVRYMVQNKNGDWRWIRYNIPNPTSLIPAPVNNPKSLVWMGMYANNTNLKYVMQSHGIKLDIWGNGTPPSNYFNFTYTLSTGVTHRMQGEEILFMDTVTGEPLWLVKYPTMQVNGTDVPLTFKKYGNQISIHAPDLFTNPEYNFSAGWELDPSTQSGSTIYISDRQNLTQVSADINNASALQNLGGGEWLLNANLINNNTANTFYINSSDVTWLKINSTNSSGTPTYWYYLSSGKTEINNTKITSWNTTSNTVEQLPVSTWARSAVYSSGAASKMNISNSNLSYLGYNKADAKGYGVVYTLSNGNNISNSLFLENFRGLVFQTSSNNTVENVTATSYSNLGILFEIGGNNILRNSTGRSTQSYGLFLESSNNNSLINSKGETLSGSYGIYLTSSNYNQFQNMTGSTTSGSAVYLYSSHNNVFVGGSYLATTTGNAYTVRDSYTNNTFIQTNFMNGKKINFYDNVSNFNFSNGSNIWLKTFHQISLTSSAITNRSLSNWTQQNITWSETVSVTGKTLNYSMSGLLVSTQYQVYNGTVIDYNLTTDAGGVLPDFTINFTTTVRTVKILQVELVGDTTHPTYSDASHNQTIAGLPTLFSIQYNDETALHPNGQWIFSTNNTGEWVNESVVNWTATPEWANVTKTLNSTVGTVIGYRWYANDNAGNTNNTPIYNLTVTTSEIPTYIPPAPVIGTVTTGNFWKNITWTAGSGNITNTYNVSRNGTWTNDSSITFKNDTTVAHGWINDTIYAWNNSGSGTLNTTGLTNNTQIPNNAPSIQFVSPTMANGSTNTTGSITINTTSSDADGDNLTAWLDWNFTNILNLHFNEGTGNNIEDSSSYKNNGSINLTNTSWNASGVFGSALDFNGVNSSVTIPSTSNNNLTGAYTIEARIYPVGWGGGNIGRIVDKYSNSTGYLLAVVSAGRLRVIQGGKTYDSNTGVINLNTSQHVAITYDGSSTLKFYVNGSLATTNSSATVLPNASIINLTIGNRIAGDRAFYGMIDEVRIMKREYSWNEINASYNATLYPLNITISNISRGMYNYIASVEDITGVINSTDNRIIYVAPASNITISGKNIYINEVNTFPVYMYAVCHESVTANCTTNALNNTNFTFHMPYSDASPSDAILTTWQQAFEGANIFWNTRTTTTGNVYVAFNETKEASSKFFGYHQIDEPTGTSPETIENLTTIYNQVKANDSIHPVSVNFGRGVYNPWLWNVTGDILMWDGYSIKQALDTDRGDVIMDWDLRAYTQLLSKNGNFNPYHNYSKPWLVTIQANGANTTLLRIPTEPELRALTYAAISQDPQGIGFWGYDLANGSGTSAGLSVNNSLFAYADKLAREITGLNSVMVLPTQAHAWYGEADWTNVTITPNPTRTIETYSMYDFSYILKNDSVNDKYYLIVVNKANVSKNDRQINITVLVGTGNGIVTTLGLETTGSQAAGRTLTSVNGVFNDSFDAYAAHIYQIENGTIPTEAQFTKVDFIWWE